VAALLAVDPGRVEVADAAAALEAVEAAGSMLARQIDATV
jgi:hypothetical protein